MSSIIVNGASLGNSLTALLTCGDIQPGDDVSYQTCKTINTSHPLGGKLVDAPLRIAHSQKRKITVQKGPEDKLVEAFDLEWKRIGATKHIANLGRISRIYGVGTLALVGRDIDAASPVDLPALAEQEIAFSIFDPLNTAGSLVLNQDPNSVDFQKVIGVAVQGQAYHRSRTVTLLNEEPIYIAYTTSAFGYVGRSVYQRALFMLKSYINAIVADDMVVTKAGALVAKIKQQSSAIDALMAGIAGQKREIVKEAQTGNVISIDVEEAIESLNLQNLEGPLTASRKNIIENIASAAGTPSKLILEETFAIGFGEGTEDAKHIAQFVDGIREWLDPAYDFFDQIVRYRAWNPAFYKTIQEQFPEEYGKKDYKAAFYEWSNSFKAEWPSLLEEPDSEKVEVDKVQMEAITGLLETLIPQLDQENKTILIRWACDNFNALKLLFSSPLQLDYDALEAYEPPAPPTENSGEGEEPKPPRPKAI